MVLVAGSAAVYDHIFRVSGLPPAGGIAEVEGAPGGSGPHFGGTAFNVAMALARLGMGVALAHPVGRDFPGSRYQARLEEAGVDCRNVIVAPGARSPRCYLFATPGGTVVGYSERLSDAVLPAHEREWPSEVSEMVLCPVWSSWVEGWAAGARGRGLPLTTVGLVSDALRPYLPAVRTIIVNEHEAQRLLTAVGCESVQDLVRLGPRHVFVTRGDRGSEVTTQEGTARVPTDRVSRVVDPTGAGDAYAAGVVAALSRGLAPRDATRVGTRVARFVVAKVGCQTNLPRWADVAPGLDE